MSENAITMGLVRIVARESLESNEIKAESDAGGIYIAVPYDESWIPCKGHASVFYLKGSNGVMFPRGSLNNMNEIISMIQSKGGMYLRSYKTDDLARRG